MEQSPPTRTPQKAAEIPASAAAKHDELLRINAAFACYAFLGLSVTAFGIVGAFLKGQEQAGYGMLLFLTLPLPMLAAFVATIVLTVKSRHYRPLLHLFLINILFITATVLVMWRQSPEGASETPVDAVILSYGAFFTLTTVWWFTAGKRRVCKAQI